MYTQLPFYKENHKLWDFLQRALILWPFSNKCNMTCLSCKNPYFMNHHYQYSFFHIFPIFCASKHAKTFLQLQIYQFQIKFCATLTYKHVSKNFLFLDKSNMATASPPGRGPTIRVTPEDATPPESRRHSGSSPKDRPHRPRSRSTERRPSSSSELKHSTHKSHNSHSG